MPSVVSAPVPLGWRDAVNVQLLVSMPWRDAALITSFGSAFNAPAPPTGGSMTAPNTDPGFVFDIASTRSIAHAVSVTDMRDDAVLDITGLSIGTDADSVFWTLQGQARGDLFERLTTGDEQAALSVAIDGYRWDFLVEDVQRSRSFNDASLTISGRSQTVTAGTPYQYAQNWINDGPTTAAQIADQAQVYTELEIDWQLEDWLVPNGVWSLTGTPLDVAKNVADAAGAIAQSDPIKNRVSITPRYPALPNEWPYLAPDIEIHLSAVLVDGYQRADQPSYNAVYVSGQQSGVVCWVRLAWTTGARLAPMITEPLITESAAGAQRGMAFLGGMGPQAKVAVTLPFLPEYGPVRMSALVRFVDGARTWYGMVRAVNISESLPTVTQQITIERHLADIDGDEAVIVLPAPPTPSPAPKFAGRLGWYPNILAAVNSFPAVSPDPTNRANYLLSTVQFLQFEKTGPVPNGYSGKGYYVIATVVPDDPQFAVTSDDVIWSFSWNPGQVLNPGSGQYQASNDVSKVARSAFGYIDGSYFIEVAAADPTVDALSICIVGTATLTAEIAGVPVPGHLTVQVSQDGSVIPAGMFLPPINVVISGTA